MHLIDGIKKEEQDGYTVYYIEKISDEFKQEIRTRLSAICHGVDQAQSKSKLYSYKSTIKEFIIRYKDSTRSSEERKKGMIGELIVHMILEIEGKYITASPFFNMEERSFKKGYDVALFEPILEELWITEVKSGSKQKAQKNASSAIQGLINTAKNDLMDRLSNPKTSLWLNALNAAKVSMSNNNSQKDVVIKLLEQCGEDALDDNIQSDQFNVILSSALFYTLSDPFEKEVVQKKYNKIIKENIFKKIIIMAIQKNTFEAVYDFLESELANEK